MQIRSGRLSNNVEMCRCGKCENEGFEGRSCALKNSNCLSDAMIKNAIYIIKAQMWVTIGAETGRINLNNQ